MADDDGGLAETERRHSANCREQEQRRTDEAKALEENGLDGVADVLDAMATIGPLIRAATKNAAKGEGTIPCPQCTRLGRESILRFVFQKHGQRRSRRYSYTAQCEREGCIRFSGH